MVGGQGRKASGLRKTLKHARHYNRQRKEEELRGLAPAKCRRSSWGLEFTKQSFSPTSAM